MTELERLEKLMLSSDYKGRIDYEYELARLAPALLAVARAAQEYIDYKDSGKLVHYGGSTRLDKVRAALSALAGKEQT
jgi:hypothetical protein